MTDDIETLRNYVVELATDEDEEEKALAALERVVAHVESAERMYKSSATRADANYDKLVDMTADRDSLRTKLERAKEALKDAIDEYEDNSQYKGPYLREKHGDEKEIARLRAVLAELSSDAPVQS